MKDKMIYKSLNLLRFISCLGVLFYHLGYLQGGFLSVCTFFVLSGYLSYYSLSKDNNFSIKNYYKKRFFHIYLPLLIVVFITIGIISFIPSIHWFNLKPETTSVILGYNNYWQLSVNSDYFARHINSPFMHFWYIGILLQFELLFPFLYLGIKKLKEKTNKHIPLIILIILIVCSITYFIYTSLGNNIMIPYYDSFARIHALLIGVLSSYIAINYKPIRLNNKKFGDIIFYLYLLIFIVIQFLIPSSSSLFYCFMIAFTILSERLVEYGTRNLSNINNIFDKIISFFSSISYEVYLVQYPILFFIQYLKIDQYLKLIIILLLVFGISILLHIAMNFKKKKIISIIFISLFGLFSLYGSIIYIVSKDYTNEINDLKKQLEDNEKLLEKKKEDYKKRVEEEKENWNKVLADIESNENALGDYITNLPIVGVGDSVMLGAVPTLYGTFPNGYFDAQVSRTDYEANRILQSVDYQGLLSDNIVIHLGTNGQCGRSCQDEILSTCGGRNVFWVTVSNDFEVNVNGGLYALANDYSNVHIIDWYSESQGHGEYFAADGIHLTGPGMSAYSNLIYQGIYNLYYNDLQNKKNQIMEKHDKEEKSKISFYGNDILLNLGNDLQEDYPNSNFTIKQDYTTESLINDLKNDKENINYNVVIAIDKADDIDPNIYSEIIKILEGHDITFIYSYHNPNSFKDDNIHIINFTNEIKKHNDYMMVDYIHLSDKGNKALKDKINKIYKIKKED